jgi:response regulator RpfG family c-di-GMP phosphodiesterase
MLTGVADQDAAIEAINSGEVFRFLTKPTSGDVLERTINAAIDQHRLITSQRILLSETLHGSIKMLTDLLALTSPETFGHATRVKSLAGELAVEMQVSPRWELEIAAMMSFVGFLTLPPEIVHKTFSLQPLRDDERALFEGYPAASRNVIANIPRMEGVARLIEFHNRDFDSSSPSAPAGIAREDIPLGSRILKAASDFQILIANAPNRETALQRMRSSMHYDPAVLAALQTVVGSKSVQVTEVPIQELRAGLVMAEDLYSSDGKTLLLARGQELSDFLVQRLRNFFQQHAADAVVAVVKKR